MCKQNLIHDTIYRWYLVIYHFISQTRTFCRQTSLAIFYRKLLFCQFVALQLCLQKLSFTFDLFSSGRNVSIESGSAIFQKERRKFVREERSRWKFLSAVAMLFSQFLASFSSPIPFSRHVRALFYIVFPVLFVRFVYFYVRSVLLHCFLHTNGVHMGTSNIQWIFELKQILLHTLCIKPLSISNISRDSYCS